MAKLTAYAALNLDTTSVWYGYVTVSNGSTIRVENGAMQATYTGRFTYDLSLNVYGRLDGFTAQSGSTTHVQLTGINRDAYKVLKLVDASDVKGLLTYVFSGADTMAGSRYADLLRGLGGDDTVRGNGGGDRLYGGGGHDALHGGDGRDALRGGTGRDQLTGGAHADSFAFATAGEAGRGPGRDFSRAQGDKIDLSAIDASAKLGGDQGFTFIGAKALSGKAGQLNQRNGVVSGDLDGDGAADFQIALANGATLSGADFLL